MRNWKIFYSKMIQKSGQHGFLSQVGHTVQGKPISVAQFEVLLEQIVTSLELRASDTLLDLCCGNGLFTYRLASHVKKTVGVDFSAELLEIARTHHNASNIQYFQQDAHQIENLRTSTPLIFDKILIYAALQHFDKIFFGNLLQQLLKLASAESIIFIGFVPDQSRKWFFINTPKRKLTYLIVKLFGRDRIGSWWRKALIESVCANHGLVCTFQNLPEETHASIYRFNVVIKPQNLST